MRSPNRSARGAGVGGGLGIDYDGSRSNYESSMNYTMREYARDVVYNIKTVCQDAGIDVPDIVTESGRAVVAPHSILITEVCDRISKTSVPPKPASKRKKVNPVLRDLQAILDNEHGSSPLERYHDAQQKKEESNSLFSLGYIDLAERAQVDRGAHPRAPPDGTHAPINGSRRRSSAC